MTNDELMLMLMLVTEVHQRQGLSGNGQRRISAVNDSKSLREERRGYSEARHEPIPNKACAMAE